MKCLTRALTFSIATSIFGFLAAMIVLTSFYPAHSAGRITLIDGVVSLVFLPISFFMYWYAEKNR